MGRESASYRLALTQPDAEALARLLDAAGLQRRRVDDERVDFVLRDPHRYWIDLRVHRRPQPGVEIRIALTNDTWAIRGPLERVLTPLPPALQGVVLRDDAGHEVAIAGTDGWWLALEDDYGRRRDEFVARVGDYTAPLSADHVYMYLHQTRWNQDNDDELAWHRERELSRLEAAWEDEPAPESEIDGP
ncbi:MAG TPA: hypothetical protein VGO80_08605 [Solirubrobacteraceae bacterium]|jgi:hypothetical protein|nr:hypothetical protein [Solirubrobacteraceae bacterium]